MTPCVTCGALPAQLRVDLHAGAFDVEERAIGLGARILAGAALGALAQLAAL